MDEVDDAIRQLGGQATLLPRDLRNAQDIDATGLSLFERFRRLDILGSQCRWARTAHSHITSARRLGAGHCG
ncbi:MAG: hypothetical protein JO122_20370 [Acetobacteraceae bacterium]|nr:hypothetical protein [Acetobacteraceae bacterium]